jgi:hypothetical protein
MVNEIMERDCTPMATLIVISQYYCNLVSALKTLYLMTATHSEGTTHGHWAHVRSVASPGYVSPLSPSSDERRPGPRIECFRRGNNIGLCAMGWNRR